jgi:peptidoglycan hydrolase-like protein with peptidoglycan-binding domain
MTTLRKGAKGSEVKKMQTALNNSGASLTVDGSFGKATKEALEVFQASKGLTPDGVCGPLTWAELEKYLVDHEALGQAVRECMEDIQGLPSFEKVMELMQYG